MTFLGAKPFSEDTAEKLGVSKRTVERLVQTAANLTPEAKKVTQDADGKISRDAALKISRLPPDQQEEAAVLLTTVPPKPKKRKSEDFEPLLNEFKLSSYHFVSCMKSFCRQADVFAAMDFCQREELWNSAYEVTNAIQEFSQKVNEIRDQQQGENGNEH